MPTINQLIREDSVAGSHVGDALKGMSFGYPTTPKPNSAVRRLPGSAL